MRELTTTDASVTAATGAAAGGVLSGLATVAVATGVTVAEGWDRDEWSDKNESCKCVI